MTDTVMTIKSMIRVIPDFPRKGILFRDITSLLKNPRGLRITINQLVNHYTGEPINKVVGIEARGFILGPVLAYMLGVGFVPVRKKGKLPGKTINHQYQLEYGVDTIEIHNNDIESGEQVLLIDDLLATGGTAEAAIRLIEKSGGSILECGFIVELPDIGGRERLELQGYKVFSLCSFEGG